MKFLAVFVMLALFSTTCCGTTVIVRRTVKMNFSQDLSLGLPVQLAFNAAAALFSPFLNLFYDALDIAMGVAEAAVTAVVVVLDQIFDLLAATVITSLQVFATLLTGLIGLFGNLWTAFLAVAQLAVTVVLAPIQLAYNALMAGLNALSAAVNFAVSLG